MFICRDVFNMYDSPFHLLMCGMPILFKVLGFVMEDKIFNKLNCALIIIANNGWTSRCKTNIVK